jgi:hypothetical protein
VLHIVRVLRLYVYYDCAVDDDAAAVLRGSRSAAPLRGGLEHYCGRLAGLTARLTELRGRH